MSTDRKNCIRGFGNVQTMEIYFTFCGSNSYSYLRLYNNRLYLFLRVCGSSYIQIFSTFLNSVQLNEIMIQLKTNNKVIEGHHSLTSLTFTCLHMSLIHLKHSGIFLHLIDETALDVVGVFSI